MDGNAQNMFHGNHQGDAYYRYDAAAPRPMGPPGAYARHRAPHPLQQQQPQYPSYQSPADNMYSMGDQHGGLGGLSDLGGWGTPANAQAGPYPAPGMTYGHPQASPQSQRQSQSQTGYRQHISPYPQQDPQKMQFPGQQGLMLQQQGYGALSQQQAQQQRVPQHYSQATTHPMYAGAPQAQPTSQSQYASYASTAAMQHQSSRPPQHVAYGHSQLDQPSYQHLSNSAAPNLHLPSAQTQPQQHSNHPVQQNQGHLGQSQQSHISHPVQPQSQIHSSQVVHPPQQQAHPQNHSQHPGLVPHSNVQQSASNIPTSQQQSHTNLGHPQSQHPQQQQTQHQNLMHPVGPVTAQHQPPLVSQQQNQTVHPIGQQLGLQMPHNHPAYGVPHPSQAGPQQTPYITPSKPQSQQQSQAQQMGSSPQYRAPFPQLSPQMSPRPPQMSPHSQMSPRQVMSPAKPLQQTPLSPHPHMPGGPSPRPSQQSGMPSQQTSKGSSSSVSTLQALEQMVMPPSNNNSGNNIEYPPSPYRPPLHQQHQSSSNPLSPMGPRMPMSPQHQQWPPINRPTSGLGNTNLNHQQQQQQQHMYAQLPSMSQINELTPLSMPPTSRSLSPFNIAELDSKKPSEYSMMQQPSEPALSIQNLVNQDTPVSSADVNLLDPFSAVMEPIAPTVTPVPIEKTHTENTHQIQQQMLHQSQLHRQDMSPIPQQPSSLQHQQPMLNDQQQLQQHNSSSHLQSHSQLHQPKIQTPSQQQQLQQIAEPHHTLHSSSNEDSSIMQSLNDNSNSNMSMPAQSLDAMKLSESDSTNENSNHPQENINEESMSSLRGNDEQSQDGLSAETIKNITDTLRSPETSPPPVEPEVEPQPTELTQSESDTLVLEPQIESVQSPAPDESSETNQVAKSPLIETPIVPTVESAAVEEIPPIVESTSQPEPTPTVQPQLTNVQTHPIAVTSAPPSVMQNSLLQQSIPMSIIPGQTMYDPIMMGVRPPTAAAGMHTMIQHPGMVYPPAPINHHAERAALQQQLQEMYCMPPNQEIQEKIVRLQERLNLLSQHEANDQCSGGSQCILQSPLYTAPMIDSPQVSSTTGRGRGRGSTKPRKPRIKKAEKLLLQQQQQQQQQQISQISADSAETLPGKNPELLPVSEDCVTPGAGLAGLTDISNEMTELNEGDDQSQDRSFADLDATTTDGRKTKKPRKPRTPKDPNKIKEPKVPKEPKEPKERKKREPRDPNEPKKKRGRKPNAEKQLLDQSGDQSMSLDTSNELNRTDDASSPIPTNQSDDGKSNDGNNQMVSDEVTDFDDIPVSKIPIKSLLEDAAKKAELDGENSQSSIPEDGSTPKRNRKSTGGPRPGSGRKRGSTKSGKKKLRHRGRIVPESDGEADDLITTPPPSPPIDPEFDSLKRRSARNTQRKKYVDDVMLSISDEESGIISPTPVKAPKEKKEDSEKKDIDGVEEVEKVDEGEEVSTTENVENSEKKEKVEKLEKKSDKVEKLPDTDNNKPNYVYVNTTDEDSMVVQHVLAMRMGKRELLPEPKQKKRKQKKADEKVVKDEVENKDYEDNVDKSNKEIGHGKSDGKDDGSNVSKEKHTEDDKEQISDHDSAEHLSLEAEEVAVPKKREGKEEMTSETQKMDVDDEEMKTDLSSPKDTALSPDEKSGNEETKENKQKEEKAEVSDAKAETDASSNKSDTESESSSDSEDEKDKPPPVMVDVEEYYVKYRNFSYLHCEWRTEEELFKGDRRVAAKIKRFQMKQAQQMNIFENLDEDPFNPDFVETDRVLDVSEHTDSQTGEKATHYLVKWKSLPYEDSTWELEKDVDSVKIEQFQQFSKIPPKDKWKPKRRPTADQWKQLSETPVYKGNNTLRPYQLEGLNWLKFSWYNSHNCILADEMGLGKTIQSLTFVHSCFEYGIRGPFLVIAPLSTIPNWQREFESWTDLNVVVYHGSVTSKQMISEYEFYYKNENGKIIKDLNKFNVLITTFEMIVTDYADLRLFNWRVCVIDEAHRLKNRNCKLLEGLRQLNLEHRVLLSGTPLQNNVNELFSLLNFLEPTQFASCDAFLKEFGSLKTESEVQKLQALLKPMMLRRLKDDVEKSLAPKTETIVEVELTNIQKKYYRGILEQNFSFLKKGTTAQNIPNLMNTMMELRKCCIHPYLLNGAEDQIQYDSRHTHGEDPDSYYKNLILSAGKMVLIDKLLPKLRSNGHRVLIFSQMVRCLDILEDYLIYRKYPFERIDGRIRGNLRQAAIDRYSKPDSDRFVFLLCTKAGGLGINLTAADTVIIYDSDWNPQNDLQAQARCHRIGQQKMVKIYRLLCRNTYEREMFDKASLKLGLDKAILQSMNTGLNSSGKETGTRQLSKKEIEDLLKKGAYGAVMDDDNAGDKFCEEDIDSILERRTQVITMEYEKGSTFSKASFAASGNRSDITIDDPDFWTKWAKKAEINENAGEPEQEDLIIAEPRRRTQIKRYGHDEGVMDMSEESAQSAQSDEEEGMGLRSKRKRDKFKKGKPGNDDYIPRDRDTLAALGMEDVTYGSWARSECFKVEKGLLSYGWGRWNEINEQGQFKRGWALSDIEDCARIILLYCLQVYRGDEKIKNFIWDLITPTESGEENKISRNHSGLHNLVPRGRNAKGRKGGKGPKENPVPKEKIPGAQNILDPNHWSRDEKYNAEEFLEPPYKKHLGRHANKVLLRVRMLYYIKHEVIGDLVQQITDGASASELPICPPPTNDQMPSSWWIPKCCDKSLLVGTYKHGCENYRPIRCDPALCFVTHLGPGDDASFMPTNEDDGNSKHETEEDVDDDGTATKDSDSKATDSKDTEFDRPSSSGIDDDESVYNAGATTSSAVDDQIWPSMQDLNTRLRRVITSYQRNYKKEELKQQQKAKLQAMVNTQSIPPNLQSATTSAQNANTNLSQAMAAAHQQQQQQQAQQQNVQQSQQSQLQQSGQQSQQGNSSQSQHLPTAADIQLMISLGLGLNPSDASQLANWDLQKLAMLLKMERRDKIDQAVKERERVRLDAVQKKWSRRDESEFLRVLTGYGVDLQQCTNVPTPDWMRFKAMAKLDKKSDESLSDYYKVFIAMCKRQAGVRLSEDDKGLEGIIDDISEDHARLVLDRLELLSKLREIVKSAQLDERLLLCQNNFDTPDWWESGKHDRELIRAVLKHGLYRSEYYIFNDPEFSFSKSERIFVEEMEKHLMKVQLAEAEAEALDNKERIIKLEQGDCTMHIEKVKKEEPDVITAKEFKEVKAEESDLKLKSNPDKDTTTDTDETPVQSPSTKCKETDEAKTEDTQCEDDEKMDIDKVGKEVADEKTEDESDDVVEVNKEKEQENEEELQEDDVEEDMDATEESVDKVESKTRKDLVQKEKKNDPRKSKDEEKQDAERKKILPEVPFIKDPATPVKDEEHMKDEDEILEEGIGDPDDDEVMKEKEKAVEEECKKQAAELKARFPDLEVIQPLVKVKPSSDQIKDIKDKSLVKAEYVVKIRWFRDFALEKRISHIIFCVERRGWPVGKSYSAYTGCQGMDLDIPLYETVKHLPTSLSQVARHAATPDVITITTDQGLSKQLQNQINATTINPLQAVAAATSKKRKRHIAIDVETERAKLHALLNSTQSPANTFTVPTKTPSAWNDDESNESRRSSGSSTNPQPPPAHQHQPLTRSTSQTQQQTYTKPQVIPGTSSTLTPIDLSSSLPKVNMADMLKSPIDLSEVQDFSMSKKQGGVASSFAGKGKLDDMLTKLMKKNNFPVEEPTSGGKEKRKRKLDEIVLGLSAAKEQKTFPDPSLPSSKKQQITPSVSVTPASAPSSSSNQSNQKPFTITVTSVPGSSKTNQQSNPPSSGLAALQNMALGGSSSSQSIKDSSLNALFAQAAQADAQAFIKQQQKILQQLPANSPQRKSYEAILSEMKQAADYNSYLNSSKYSSHEAKVNKWLAEQTAALSDSHLVDYRRSSTSSSSSSRQQQQQQPSHQNNSNPLSAGMKNLTGEENVAVIHRMSGKRLTGSKAPQLKRLNQFLNENPAYEIDPKWMELIQTPSSPSPKPSPSESTSSSTSSKQQPHRSSSTGQSTGSNQQGSYSGQSQSSSKKGRPNLMDANAQMQQFAGLASLNPSLLAGLPMGGFDPKNPLLMPFGGMPGLAGMGSSLGNLNNMNLFANLAGLSGLGAMDAQSLAAMVAAAGGTNLGNLGKTSGSGNASKDRKSGGSSTSTSSQQQQQQQQQQQSSNQQQSTKTPTSSANSSASNSNFPFLFPNPSLLYTPLGLGGLNPYGHSPGLSVYDQLAQQYSLLNGGLSSTGTTSTSNSSTTTSARQSQGKSSGSSSRTSAMGNSTTSQSTRSRNSSMSSALSRGDTAQLQSLLMPQDPHLLESLSRVAGLDITQGSRMASSGSSSKSHNSSKDLYDKAEKERRKLMESLNRGGLPPDLAAMQAFAQGKLPSSSSKSSKESSIPLPMSPEFSQVLFAEMAAQAVAAAASSSSSNSSSAKRRDQEMKEALEQLSKSQVELFARNLGMGSGISLTPTSSSSTSVSALNDEHKSRRSRQSDHVSITTPTKDDITAHLVSDDKPSPSRRSETTMEKVTLTPVAAASIASLPPQTTITIAPTTLPASTSNVPSSILSTMSSSSSSNVPENLSSSLKQKSPTPQSHRPMPPPSPQQQMVSPPTRASPLPPLPPPQAIPPSHHEMDLEDLIAPSKVSKGSFGGTNAGDEMENSSVSDQDHEIDKQNMDASSNSSNPDEADKKATSRRTTRGKRPRSGEDFEIIGIPERKRELRSSAGRLAAAAAARHAAEAKLAASSQDTLNLSTSSNDDNDRSES